MDQQAENDNLIAVIAYAGHKAEEKPQKFTHQDHEYIIEKIVYQSINECLETGQRVFHFRVVCQDDQEREINYNPQTDQWYLKKIPNQ